MPEERSVRRMFDRVAPRYDLLNRVMAANLDQRWRRAAARAVVTRGRGPFLDVGAGTGDLTIAIANEARRRSGHGPGPGPIVVGLDLARAMLEIGRKKGAPAMAQGSGLAIPTRDATFEGITNAFVLRNLADLDAFFAEAHRALQPGGKLVSLEIGRPRGRIFGPLYRAYFYRIMPRLGRMLSSDPDAYQYLAESVKRIEPPEALVARMRKAGFADAKATPLMRGAVWLFEATRPS